MKKIAFLIFWIAFVCSNAGANIIIPASSQISLLQEASDIQYVQDSVLVSATDNGFFYCYHGDSVLYFFGETDIQPKPIINTHVSIHAIATRAADCIIAHNNQILLYDAKTKALYFVSSTPDMVTAIAPGFDNSYFYGTESKLYYLSAEKTIHEIASQGVTDVLRYDSSLVVTFANQSVWIISHCDSYNNWAKEISNTRKKNEITIDGYKTTIINDGDSVNLSDLTYTTIPGQGLFGILGNHLVPMEIDKTDITEYAMPDSTYMIDQILILQNMFIYKSGSSVLHVNSLQRTRGFSLDSEDFSIAQASDTSLYILTNGLVYECDARRGNPKLVFTAPTKDKILLYKPIGTDTYAASGTSLYVVKNGQCHVLAKLSSPITCINFSGHGIWIGTNHGLYQYQGYNKLVCYSEQSIQQLLDEGDKLYIITDDSNIYRLQKQPQTNTKKKTKSKNR